MSEHSRQIIIIAHNLRSCHNVGSLLRTAEGLGVEQVIFTGYTPFPVPPADSNILDARMPHEAAKLARQIHKTALGAEDLVDWRRETDVFTLLDNLRADGWRLAAVEQSPDSIELSSYLPPKKLVLLVGREVEGVEPDVLAKMDDVLEIPMLGQKESFNVVQAAAMATYHCRFYNVDMV